MWNSCKIVSVQDLTSLSRTSKLTKQTKYDVKVCNTFHNVTSWSKLIFDSFSIQFCWQRRHKCLQVDWSLYDWLHLTIVKTSWNCCGGLFKTVFLKWFDSCDVTECLTGQLAPVKLFDVFAFDKLTKFTHSLKLCVVQPFLELYRTKAQSVK